MQIQNFDQSRWGRAALFNPIQNDPTPTTIAVPKGQDLADFQEAMQTLDTAFVEFENQFTTLYDNYNAGSISKEDYLKALADATLPYGKTEGTLIGRQDFKELVAKYPTLGQYQGLDKGFVADLQALAQQIVFSPMQQDKTPADFRELWNKISLAEQLFEQSGVYECVFSS